MKANELRIGNLVNFRDEDHIFLVTKIDNLGIGVKDSEQETWIEYDCFDPIKITEDWLEKLGFIKKIKQGIRYEIESDICVDLAFSISGWHLEVDGLQCFQSIKYVHRLQNLYHALTGEELNLSL